MFPPTEPGQTQSGGGLGLTAEQIQNRGDSRDNAPSVPGAPPSNPGMSSAARIAFSSASNQQARSGTFEWVLSECM